MCCAGMRSWLGVTQCVQMEKMYKAKAVKLTQNYLTQPTLVVYSLNPLDVSKTEMNDGRFLWVLMCLALHGTT